MEHKSLDFHLTELKAGGAGGWEVAGYASTFGGDPDTYGDIVARGAFLDSLAKRPNVRLLYQHDLGEPIGKVVSLAEDEKGLFGRWSLVPTDTGTKAHQLLEHGLVDSLSIGFLTKDAEYRDDGTRILKAVDLVEVSLVTVPANTGALVTSFKSPMPFTTLLERAGEAFAVVTREAKALRDRRAADSRPLNDRQQQAIADFLAEAKALHEELAALVVVAPEAKADEPEALRLRLELARRKFAAILRESA